MAVKLGVAVLLALVLTSASAAPVRTKPTLQQINAQGELSGDTIWPVSDAYLARLRKFLLAHGYGKG